MVHEIRSGSSDLRAQRIKKLKIGGSRFEEHTYRLVNRLPIHGTSSQAISHMMYTCNFFMKQLVEEGDLDKAMAVYEPVKKKGFRPNAYTYGIVVEGRCKKGYLKEVVEVFEGHVKKKGFCPILLIFDFLYIFRGFRKEFKIEEMGK
ncbi:hypothetical protein LXL04_009988 [Taraxacum kok-saghyz]